MDFGEALNELKAGKKAARIAWGAALTFVVIMPALDLPPFDTQGTYRKVNDRTAKWIGEDQPLNCQPYFASYVRFTNAWQPGWAPTNEDMLATDWVVQE
jgi:hypothetical protein